MLEEGLATAEKCDLKVFDVTEMLLEPWNRQD